MRKALTSARLASLACLALLLGTVACVSRSQAPPSGYLDHSGRMSEGVFKGQFVASSADLRRFTKVQIADLRLDGLAESGKYPAKEVAKLATAYREAFETELSKSFVIVARDARADGQTVVVQGSLVSLQTPNIPLNWVTTFLIGPATDGGAGFEAKLVDGASGQTVAEISEKHSGGTTANALFVAPYQKYGHSKEAFRSWAERTGELLQGPEAGG